MVAFSSGYDLSHPLTRDLRSWGLNNQTWTSVDATSVLQAAAQAFSAITGGIIEFNVSHYFNPSSATTITIPANVELRFAPGAVVRLGSNVTLSIIGKITAGAWQIFDTSAGGVVTTTNDARTEEVRPEWWGAVPGGANGTGTDSSAAMQAAQVFSETFGGTLMLRAVIYTMNATLNINKPSKIVGAAPIIVGEYGGQTVLDFTNAPKASHGLNVNPTGTILLGCEMSNFAVYRSQVAAGSNCFAIVCNAVDHGIFRGMGFSGFDQLLSLRGSQAVSGDSPCIACMFESCLFDSHATRSILWANATSIEFRNCEIRGYGSASEVIYLGANSSTLTNDTALFLACRIGNYQLPPVLVRIAGGFYHTFTDCDLETSTQAAIGLVLGTALDVSTPCFEARNCWFDNCGVNVANYGSLPSFSVIDCPRMVANAASTQTETGTGRSVSVAAAGACVTIDSSDNVQRKMAVVIRGNNMTVNNTSGYGVTLNHVNAARVQDNQITLAGTARAGVALGSTTGNCLVTGNTITSSSTLVNDGGTGNYTTGNYGV